MHMQPSFVVLSSFVAIRRYQCRKWLKSGQHIAKIDLLYFSIVAKLDIATLSPRDCYSSSL